MKIVILTRGSKLALKQTEIVCNKLKEKNLDFEIEIVQTQGDKSKEPLYMVQETGIFVKKIEEKLLKYKELKVPAIAVHSFKDVPKTIPEELEIISVMKRDSPFDILITNDGRSLSKLPIGARIGTSSSRRIAQLLKFRKDIEIVPLRGNIDTRLKKLEKLDGIVIAEASIKRLGLNLRYKRLGFTPAPCQGIIAVETYKCLDENYKKILRSINDERTFFEASVERFVMTLADSGCKAPVGIYCKVDRKVNLRVELLTLDGDVLFFKKYKFEHSEFSFQTLKTLILEDLKNY